MGTKHGSQNAPLPLVFETKKNGALFNICYKNLSAEVSSQPMEMHLVRKLRVRNISEFMKWGEVMTDLNTNFVFSTPLRQSIEKNHSLNTNFYVINIYKNKL